MHSRIKEDLNKFLEEYDLEMSSRIFENSIPILAGLKLSEFKMTGFHFTKQSNPAGCQFSAPKLDEDNKSKLLNFCGNISTKVKTPDNEQADINQSNLEIVVNEDEEDYSDRESSENSEGSEEYANEYDNGFEEMFEISEQHLESTVIPAFKAFITTLNHSNPDFMKLHQARSKERFATIALNNMKEQASLLLDELEKKQESTEQEILLKEISLKYLLETLIKAIKSLKSYYAYDYSSLRKTLSEFNYLFRSIEEVVENGFLYTDKFKNIIDNLKIYLRVNPIKEHLEWQSISLNLNSFLYDLKISVNGCDIFENTLLQLAGISNYGTHCKFEMDREDPSCMSLRIPNLSPEDAEKFLHFFHQHGAATAKITSSCYVDGEASEMMRDESGRFCFYTPSISVTYRIASTEVINKILPLFYAKITEIKQSDVSCLQPYQDESKPYFKEHKSIFSEFLNKKKNKLTIRGDDLLSGKIPALCNFLKENPSIKTLKLINCELDDQSAKWLSTIQTISTLSVQGNNIGDEGVGYLAQMENLESLDLSENKIGKAGIIALAKNTKLRHLNISGNRINDTLAGILATNTHLIHLDLHDNYIQDEGAVALANNPNLLWLDLRNNNISDEGAGAFKLNSSLNYLNLNSNFINNKGVKQLAQNTHITILDLSSNHFNQKAVAALSRNIHLRRLSLCDVGLTYDDLWTLVNNKTLVHLNLSSNGIGDTGACIIAQSSTLQELDLLENDIGDHGIRALAKNTSLLSLDVTDNPFTDAGAISFRDNENLKFLLLDPYPGNLSEEVTQSIYERINKNIESKNIKLKNNTTIANAASALPHRQRFTSTLSFWKEKELAVNVKVKEKDLVEARKDTQSYMKLSRS